MHGCRAFPFALAGLFLLIFNKGCSYKNTGDRQRRPIGVGRAWRAGSGGTQVQRMCTTLPLYHNLSNCKYLLQISSLQTCQDEADQTKGPIAAPADKAWIDDGDTSERLWDMLDDGRLSVGAHQGHLLQQLGRRRNAVSYCLRVSCTWWRGIVRCARYGRSCIRVRRTVSLGWRIYSWRRVSLVWWRVCCCLGHCSHSILRRRRLWRWKLLMLLAVIAMHLIVQFVLSLHGVLSKQPISQHQSLKNIND